MGPQEAFCLNPFFPPQPQNMVSTNLTPLQGGMEGTPHPDGSSSNVSTFMCDHPSFPPQPQNMVSTNPTPLQGGMEGTPHPEGSSSNVFIFVCDQMVNFQM
jgi:hypothetical protein